MHLINEESLLASHRRLSRKKSTGIDNIRKEDYDKNLFDNIKSLVKRMKEWSYCPQPVKRVDIPKSDGNIRSLGIPCYEDKLVQMCLRNIL